MTGVDGINREGLGPTVEVWDRQRRSRTVKGWIEPLAVAEEALEPVE